MTQYESVKAFAENIDKRRKDLMAAGKTEQEATDVVNRKLAEAGVAADVRERRGLVAGFGRQGVELGGFERYERIARETPEDFEKGRVARYEQSKQGRQDKIDVAEAVTKAEVGERNEGLARWRQIAETELTKGGAFERVQPAAEAASHIPGASDARTILINQQAIRRAAPCSARTNNSATRRPRSTRGLPTSSCASYSSGSRRSTTKPRKPTPARWESATPGPAARRTAARRRRKARD